MVRGRSTRQLELGIVVGILCLGLAGISPAAAQPTHTEAGAAQQPAQQEGLEALVRRVQEGHRQIHDLQARFVQRRGAPGGRTLEARGTLYIKLPGRMRWEYESPEPRVAVTGGERLYWYLPADNQVQVFDLQSGEVGQTPTLYLAGQGDLVRDFRVEEGSWGVPLSQGNVQLRLLPVHEDAPFESLQLEVDPDTAMVARLVVVDLLGNATDYQFHDREVNVGLPDSLFEFRIPPAAEVIYVGS